MKPTVAEARIFFSSISVRVEAAVGFSFCVRAAWRIDPGSRSGRSGGARFSIG